MKHKDEIIEYKKAIEQMKLAYVLRLVEMQKSRKELEDKVTRLERAVSDLQPKPQPAVQTTELPRGNRKTKIHFISVYTNKEELMKGFKIVEKLAPLGIVDEINVEIPVRNIEV